MPTTEENTMTVQLNTNSEFEQLRAIAQELKEFAETYNVPVVTNNRSANATRPDESSILPVPSFRVSASDHLEYFDGRCYCVTILKDRTKECE